MYPATPAPVTGRDGTVPTLEATTDPLGDVLVLLLIDGAALDLDALAATLDGLTGTLELGHAEWVLPPASWTVPQSRCGGVASALPPIRMIAPSTTVMMIPTAMTIRYFTVPRFLSG